MSTLQEIVNSVHADLIHLQRGNKVAIDFIEFPPLRTLSAKEIIAYFASFALSELLFDLYPGITIFPKISARPTYHPEIEAAIKRHGICIEYRASHGDGMFGSVSRSGTIVLHTLDRMCLFHELSSYAQVFIQNRKEIPWCELKIVSEWSALTIFKYLYGFNYAYVGNSIEFIDTNVKKYAAEASPGKKTSKEQVLDIIYPKVVSCVKALIMNSEGME